MTEQTPISFDLPGQGKVIMVGEGPWRTTEIGHSREIRDSKNAVANPTVVQRFSGTTSKPNANVIFAKPSIAEDIVRLANEAFDQAATAS